jgi:hypothetical protein
LLLRFLALEFHSRKARVTWPLPPRGEAVRKGERELMRQRVHKPDAR